MSGDSSGLPPVPLMPLLARDPQQLGGFRLLGRLGSGGMGTAFLAQGPKGWVVVKEAHAGAAGDAQARARFRREVDAMVRAQGPWMARLIEADVDAEVPWVAMEFVPGQTLAQVVDQQGPLSGTRLNDVAMDLARGLVHLHGHAVLHRDLKPGNVMLSPDGARMIDLGVAEVGDATALTSTGSAVGSTGWMSPEQVRGDQLGPASDVHAWALCVLFAATGVAPFAQDNSLAMMYSVIERMPSVPDTIDEPLRSLIVQALAKEPRQRPTAEEIVGVLQGGVRHSESIPATAPTAPVLPTTPLPPVPPATGRPMSGGGRRAVAFAVGGLVLVVAVALAIGAVFPRSGEEAPSDGVAAPASPSTDPGGAGASPDTSPGEPAPGGPVGITLITKDDVHPFFLAMREGATEAAAAVGADVTLAAGRDDADDQGQIDLIDQAIARGDRGILITPTSTNVNAAIQRARDAGLYVISLDTPTTPANAVDLTIATDQCVAGEAIGQWAAGWLDGRKAVIAELVIFDDRSVSVDYCRANGFLTGMGIPVPDPEDMASAARQGSYSTGAGGEYEIACLEPSLANEDGGRTAMEECLSLRDDINVVYAINEPAALGALDALKKAGKSIGEDVIVVSIDGGYVGVQAVEAGQIQATSQQDPGLMARLGVEAIATVAAGGAPPEPTSPDGEFFDSGVTLCTETPMVTVTVAEQRSAARCLESAWG